MRIVSLLPSATEIVYALGLGDRLEAVTDACDHPADAATKPVVSRSTLPQGPMSAGGVDAAVRERVGDGEPLYELDRELLRQIRPDVILTQDLCRVCAIPSGRVDDALAELGVDARVLSLDPRSLDEVLATIPAVGSLLGAEAAAEEFVAGLRERIDRVRRTAARLPSIRVLALEWSDPPFVAGHWVPEMVDAVGAVNLLNEPERSSRTVTWREIADAMPEVVVFMPCGYYLEEAEEEGPRLLEVPEFRQTPAAQANAVFGVDATSHFSRPGPRLVDGIEALAWVVHPDAFPAPPQGTVVRIGR